MSYWKTETINGEFHMYKGECPNYYWEEYDPDIDTQNYYEDNAKIKSGYAVINIKEDEI